jgi:cation diffusion facilitator family transporter
MQNVHRYKTAKKVALFSASSNLLLAVSKVIFGLLGRSHALFADGIDSFADLFSDFLMIMAVKVGSHAPDQEHPYGHGRIETIIAMVLAIILLISGGVIIFNVWHSILRAHLVKPKVYTLIIAGISVLFNEGLFHYIARVGKQIYSNALNVSAWHHRGDALSSVVVLLGIGGSILGLRYLDSIAAIIVALLIIRMAVQMIWRSVRELIDTAVDQSTLQKINASIVQVHGVYAVHQLRTRSLGGLIFVEVHVLVDPHISVSEGHFVANKVMEKIQVNVPKVADVLVHVDVEDDEKINIKFDLPSREELQIILQQRWQNLPGHDEIKQFNLHYLHNKVEVEILLPVQVLRQIGNLEDLSKKYQTAVKDLNYIASIKFWLS